MEAENNSKSIVYLTVNTVNNKKYVGVHITADPDKFDGYYGCGISGTSSYWFKYPKYPFQKACKKYGLNVFKRYTIAVYDSYEDALKLEKLIVTEEFVKRQDTYNVALGGGSGLVPSTEVEVFQYNQDGEFIKSYRSKQEAARQNNTTFQTIHYAILNSTQYNQCYWAEYKIAKLDLSKYKQKQNTIIYIYNLDGSFKEESASLSAFCKKYEITQSVARKAMIRQTKCNKLYISQKKVDKFIPMTKKRIRHTTVYRYNKKGEFIDTLTYNEAKDLLGTSFHKIHDAIRGEYLCGGYYWSNEKKEIILKRHKQKIAQYDMNNNLIKIWDTFRECQKHFTNVRFVLNGTRSHTKGFKFKRLEN